MKPETKCIHGFRHEGPEGAISMPIFQSATYAHPAVGQSTGYDYARLQSPTREAAEKVIASLENAADALAFPTGMAAMTALMELFKPGDHIISTEDLYGGSIRLFEHISRKNGIEVDFVNTSDLGAVQALINPRTRAIFIETPTNPMMHVTDIAEIVAIARGYHILVIVDNTFLTPFLMQPLDLGADIVLHSATKYLSGHNDTMAGFLALSDQNLIDRLRFIHKTTGACLSPFDSWLTIRGVKTLALRMERAERNAMVIAEWLLANTKSVHYAGLATHPGYAVSKKQARGFGAMISFEVENEVQAMKILKSVKLIRFAESLGGVETLITYPTLQTHADVSQEAREARGINDRLLRLSIGVEHVDDLIEDLKQAMEA